MKVPRPTTCRTCGTAISQEGSDRPRLYCSAKCRHSESEKARRKGCKVEGCAARPTARGYCPPHYYQAKGAGLFGRGCSVDGCERGHYGHGLCSVHLRRAKVSGSVPTDHCSVDGCEKVVLAKGLCAMHDWRVRTHGEVGEVGRKRGEDGAGHVDRNGYISIQIDNRRVLQHRLVMEQLIGRPLEAHESVHHINGVRDDNRPENLELWSRSQPSGQRVADKVAWALDLLALYAPERLAT